MPLEWQTEDEFADVMGPNRLLSQKSIEFASEETSDTGVPLQVTRN